jgi:hypothetical protein
MSIARMSDAVVRWLVPQTTAAACLAPEPCGTCAHPVTSCYNGRMRTWKYTLTATDCNGQCRLSKRMLCDFYDGRIC